MYDNEIIILNEATYRIKIGLLVMKGIDSMIAGNEEEQEKALRTLNEKYGGRTRKVLKEIYPIDVYCAYYKKFGYSYHVLGQLESVLGGKKSTGSDSALLQAMFSCELEGMMLTAGHDLSVVNLPLSVKIADGTETYVSISGKEVCAVKEDAMICDGMGTISSILRGPDERTRIKDSTSDVLFTVYAPPGIDKTDIEASLRRLEQAVLRFSPEARTESLRVL